MKADNRAHTYLDDTHLKEIKTLADKKGMSLASLIRMIIIEYLDSLKIKTK